MSTPRFTRFSHLVNLGVLTLSIRHLDTQTTAITIIIIIIIVVIIIITIDSAARLSLPSN